VISAFGVEHGEVSKLQDPKRRTVPDWLSPVLPASTVRAYDKSKKNKLEAAAGNLGAKTIGGAAGAALGLGAATIAGKKIKVLREGVKVAGHSVDAKTLRGWTQATASSGAGGATGGVLGGAHLSRVKEDKKRYDYQ